MSPTNRSPKSLSDSRQEEVTNRFFGSRPREPDGLFFDWELPELTAPLVLTFIAEIRDEKTAQAASDYFILDESAAPGEMLSVKLGASCELSYSFSAQVSTPYVPSSQTIPGPHGRANA